MNRIYHIDCFNVSFYNARMVFLFRWVLIATVCIILFDVAFLRAVIIDRIAGVIDGEVIPYRSVLIEKRFKLTGGSDRDVLQKIIDRRLLLKEAKRFKITETAEDIKTIQEGLQDLKVSLGEEEFADALCEYELKETDLIGLIKKRIIIERFIDFRINFFIVVSDEAIKGYYNDHRNEFGEKTLEDVYEEIKRLLFQIESNRRLEEYLNQLRKNARILINL